MLFINLFVIDRCSERKYSAKRTYAVMGFFIVLLIVPSYALVTELPNFGDGNGLFVFLGFLFAFPVKLLYRVSVTKIISVACTSWTYTFFLFSISAHISYMVDVLPRAYTTFFSQTVLYIISFVWFYNKLKFKLFPLLSQLTAEETHSLMWMSIAWFWTAFIVNLAFVYPSFYLLRVVAVVSLTACSYHFYQYTYRVISSSREIESLEQIAYHDSLTQLRSRSLLTSDVDELIRRGIPFTLVFMDLNHFKRINDEYGHNTGDEYLSFFARETKRTIGNNGGFYRISGDEFVGILVESDGGGFLETLERFPETINEAGVPFLGVSYGTAAYPDEAVTLELLLELADSRMYKMKRKKHGRDD